MTTASEPSGLSPNGSGWPAAAAVPQIAIIDDGDAPLTVDPGIVILTCANCGAPMDERKCKLICTCGYFLSCSDYY